MKIRGAAEFKAHCLALLDEVALEHQELLILKRGRPVARVIPVQEREESPQATLRGTVAAADDLIAPPLPPDDWEAEG